jgi:hypothetical protein
MSIKNGLHFLGVLLAKIELQQGISLLQQTLLKSESLIGIGDNQYFDQHFHVAT